MLWYLQHICQLRLKKYPNRPIGVLEELTCTLIGVYWGIYNPIRVPIGLPDHPIGVQACTPIGLLGYILQPIGVQSLKEYIVVLGNR